MRVTTRFLFQSALRTAARGGRAAPAQRVGGHASRAGLEVSHG